MKTEEKEMLTSLDQAFNIIAGLRADVAPEKLDALAERIACSLWGYFNGGSAGSADAMRYFDYHKASGGPRHVIERVRVELQAQFKA